MSKIDLFLIMIPVLMVGIIIGVVIGYFASRPCAVCKGLGEIIDESNKFERKPCPKCVGKFNK